jgi:hypothetical protein
MKNNITTLVFTLSMLFIMNAYLSSAQTVTVGSITANPGDNILVPITFNNLNNIGAITLFILYDPALLTFNGITNLVPEGTGTLANGMTNPTRVGIAWSASTNGVNFPNGKYLDMQFTFLGGSTSLEFSNDCEIADWDANPISVNYVDGGASAPAVTFNLTVFLEGAYQVGSGGLMRKDLNIAGVLPNSQPYAPSLPYYGNPTPKWYYMGSENVANLPANAVDWVVVELRDAATAAQATTSTIVARKACLLMSNGSILELDGSSMPSFFTSFNNGAFVVIWHRNHLGVMSAGPIAGLGNSYSYNFSTGASQVYGGSTGYKLLETNIWGMVAGNINADNQINSTDKTNGWTIDATKRGYLGTDANLNVQVNNPDKNGYILINIGKFSSIPN